MVFLLVPAALTFAFSGTAAPPRCPDSGRDLLNAAYVPVEPDMAAEVEKAIASRCPGEVALGPVWSTDGGTFVAGTGFDGGATSCLALAQVQGDGGVRVVAAGEVPSGWSDRYQEAFAPDILPAPAELAGQLPMPLTKTTTMGHGGGGGATVHVLSWNRKAWRSRSLGSVGGATNINTYVESEGQCEETLIQGKAGRAMTLRLSTCFDGKPLAPRCFTYKNGGFSER
ncbi:hypothetical protein ACLESD_09270 [Pyxidicoccus sp. 3LFB2]